MVRRVLTLAVAALTWLTIVTATSTANGNTLPAPAPPIPQYGGALPAAGIALALLALAALSVGLTWAAWRWRRALIRRVSVIHRLAEQRAVGGSLAYAAADALPAITVLNAAGLLRAWWLGALAIPWIARLATYPSGRASVGPARHARPASDSPLAPELMWWRFGTPVLAVAASIVLAAAAAPRSTASAGVGCALAAFVAGAVALEVAAVLWQDRRKIVAAGVTLRPQMSPEARRNLRSITLSNWVTRIGTNGSVIALNFYIAIITKSAWWVAAVLIATTVAKILSSILLGWLGDYFDKRRVMMNAELVGCACYLVLLAFHGPLTIVVVAAAAAAAGTPFQATAKATIPLIVARESAPIREKAGPRFYQADTLATVIGPGVAAIVIGLLGPVAMFAGNAVSFAISAYQQSRLRLTEERPAPTSWRELMRQIVAGLFDGLKHVRDSRRVSLIAGATIGVFLCSGIVQVLEPQLALALGDGEKAQGVGFGVLGACWALGNASAAFVAERMSGLRTWPAMAGGLTTATVAAAAISVAPTIWIASPLTCLVGMGMGVFFATRFNKVNEHTPAVIRSRTWAAIDGLGDTAQMIGMGMAGLSLTALAAGTDPQPGGPAQRFYLVGALFMAAAAATLFIGARTVGRNRPKPGGDGSVQRGVNAPARGAARASLAHVASAAR